MYFLLMMILILLILSFLMFYLNILLSKKKYNYREKMIPIECGFNMINKINLPFSIQFYYISILFLIFDVEISLIFPYIQKINYMFIYFWLHSFYEIMILLLIGLYIEWKNNLIKWYY